MSGRDCDSSITSKPVDVVDTMPIPSDEHFSLTNSQDGTVITFLGKDNNIHKARISNWHLQPVWGLDLDSYADDPVARALSSIRVIFGNKAFAEFDSARPALAELNPEASSTPVDQEDAKKALDKALVNMMFRSEMSHVFLPLTVLGNRGNKYNLIYERWPFRTPPSHLVHLGSRGFDGKSHLGILAAPEHDSREYWIVDQFDQNQRNTEDSLIEFSKIVNNLTSGLVSDISALKADTQNIRTSVNHIVVNTEAIAKGNDELRQDNSVLQEMRGKGLLRFVTQVDADDFRAFAAILITGNQNKASQALGIASRTFYDRVNSWISRGPAYKRMHRMTEWRKKVSRKTIVRLNDSLLGTEDDEQAENPQTMRDALLAMHDKNDIPNHEDFLRDILEAISNLNRDNWPDIKKELTELIEEQFPQ